MVGIETEALALVEPKCEIPPFLFLMSNRGPETGSETVYGRQFDWGGRLQKSNGGARRFPQAEWKPAVECKGTRELNCETDRSNRWETRS